MQLILSNFINKFDSNEKKYENENEKNMKMKNLENINN